MVRRLAFVCAFTSILSGAALADPLGLVNADMENNASIQFGAIDGWGPNGGWALHSGFPAPGNGGLGDEFGFFSAGLTETVGQIVAGHAIQANTTYQFWGWIFTGNDGLGTAPFQLGYAATDDDLASFVALATNAINIDAAASWAEVDGVTYTTGDSGAELGRQLIVRFGQGSDGGATDIWFDNLQASATPVPEPATMAALALGAVAMLRRRK